MSHPQSPLFCVTCSTFLRIDRNSVVVQERTADGRPSKLWSADRWKCPVCDYAIVSGFAHEPLAEPAEPEYQQILAATPADEMHRETTAADHDPTPNDDDPQGPWGAGFAESN